MKIITGTTGVAHITPQQDAFWHRGWMGIPTCVFPEGQMFAPQIMSNSTVRVKDGICSLQGRYMCIDPSTYDEVHIDNGSQGYKRIDLICGKLTIGQDGKSTSTLEVIKGTPSTSTPQMPTVPTKNLDGGDNYAYIPLVKVELNGINITNATMIADTYRPVIIDDELEAKWTEILGDISY